MKLTAIVSLLAATAAFAATPVAALPKPAQPWEASLFVGQQTHNSTTIVAGTDGSKPEKVIVPAIRLGYDFFTFSDTMSLQGNIGCQFEKKAEIQTDVKGKSISFGSYSQESISLGAMFQYRNVVDLGAGLDWRFEKNNIEAGGVEGYHRNSRPWVRANVGYTFASSSLSPFVKFEVAAPLKSDSYDHNAKMDTTSENNAIADALASKLQIGLVGGVRF